MVRRKKRRGGKSITRTVMKLMRTGALIAPAAQCVLNPNLRGNDFGMSNIIYRYSGYNMADGSFDAGRLIEGWGPFVVTTLVTYGVQKLSGIIRRL